MIAGGGGGQEEQWGTDPGSADIKVKRRDGEKKGFPV